MKRLASLAVPACCIVLAFTGQLLDPTRSRTRYFSFLHRHATRRMPITFTTTSNREIGHSIMLTPRSCLLLPIHFITLVNHVKTVEDHPYIGSGHPVLQNRRLVKVRRARATFQSTERQPRSAVGFAGQSVTIRASGFLFVSGGDGSFVRPAVHSAALARVKLEGLPGASVICTLVDRHRIGPSCFRAELQTDIGQLVLLSKR